MNNFTGGFAPQQSAMQPQSPVMAPAQTGYQQQLAQALKAQPMASSDTPDPFGQVNDMIKRIAMNKLMGQKELVKPSVAPPIADAGITNQPMLSQYGSMLG